MSGMPDSNPRKKSALLGALLPIVIILITAGLYWFLSGSNKGGNQSVDSEQSIKLKGGLVSGQTYYIFASEVEVYPTNSENEPWDRGEKGPDIRYRILWKGNEVFESETKDDSLIADWSGLSLQLDWRDITGKSISPDEAIKAARVRFEENEKIEFVTEDVDVAADDKVGRHEIKLDELSIGKNQIKLNKSTDNAVRRITLRVLPVGSSIRDLANIMN